MFNSHDEKTATWLDLHRANIYRSACTGDTEVPYDMGPNSNNTMQYGPLKIIERATSVGIPNKLVSVNSTNHNAPLDCDSCFDQILMFLDPLITNQD